MIIFKEISKYVVKDHAQKRARKMERAICQRQLDNIFV